MPGLFRDQRDKPTSGQWLRSIGTRQAAGATWHPLVAGNECQTITGKAPSPIGADSANRPVPDGNPLLVIFLQCRERKPLRRRSEYVF
jgi:hypothetical protein